MKTGTRIAVGVTLKAQLTASPRSHQRLRRPYHWAQIQQGENGDRRDDAQTAHGDRHGDAQTAPPPSFGSHTWLPADLGSGHTWKSNPENYQNG